MISQKMKDYLPRYYDESKVVNNMLDVESTEVTALNNSIQDILNQLFVDTATWGLDRWEKLFNIPTVTTKSYTERRSIIKSKIRGYGTVTIDLIKNIASSYANGDVLITEVPPEYKIKVEFVSTLGVPGAIDELKASIRQVLPAHLNIDYIFRFLTWDALDAAQLAFIDIEDMGLTWDELESLKVEGVTFVKTSIALTGSEQ